MVHKADGHVGNTRLGTGHEEIAVLVLEHDISTLQNKIHPLSLTVTCFFSTALIHRTIMTSVVIQLPRGFSEATPPPHR